MPTALWILFSLLIGFVLVNVMAYLFQSGMMYYPNRHVNRSPADLGIDFEDVYFTSGEGVTIHGWFVPASDTSSTVLFSHGNAGNISDRLETIRIFHGLGLNTLIYDYEGYGKSEGNPSEAATYRNAQAAHAFLVEQKNIPPQKIILMGRSLGGAVAAWLATQTKPAGLILESTFTSAKDLAAEIYPFLPVRWLMKFEYPTEKYLRQIELPVIILHSPDDQLIPFHHGEKLYKAASKPKHFFKMEGGHGNSHIATGQDYIQALDEFIASLGLE